MQYPRPKLKSKRKAKNNPVPTDQDRCRICDKPYAELHEVFYGPLRQKSIEYKMQVRLCDKHHRIDKLAVHNNPIFDAELKREYQLKFESIYGHEEFMLQFGRNYLDSEVPA